jgi:RimJ/RimL family protein N-acetyltransferase
MKILITTSTETDKDILLKMNKQLMEDEQFDRILSDEILSNKWDEFLTDDKFTVVLFLIDDDITGYAIVQTDLKPLYLRHFFIKREFRRKGYGRESFNAMLEFLNTNEIDLDVMSWNERGMKFWESLGFTERCRMMTLKS